MSEQELRDLGERWAQAELDADAGALDALLDEDFLAVGPAGFILSKHDWLARYKSGDLTNHSFTWEIEHIRVFGNSAVLIGRQQSTSSHQDRPVGGQFRVTQTAVRRRSGWVLVGIHLGPLAQRPPTAH